MKFFASIILIFISVGLWAQAPKYSNEFMNIGVGAQALGMSNSVVASAKGVTAGYWNPAGLVNTPKPFQVALMHSEYFAGLAKFDYGAFSSKIDSSSSFGFTLLRFGVDNIPNTTELIDNNGNINYDRITSFSAADYGFLFTYARKSKIEGLNYGANVKIIYRKVGSFAKAYGFGLDAGVQYKHNKWLFGAMARDITSTFNAWSYTLTDRVKEVFIQTGNEIPTNGLEITLPRLILGVNRMVTLTKKINFNAEVNFDATFDGMRNVLIKSNTLSIDPHVGIEFSYAGLFYIRGGVGNFQEVKDIYQNTDWTFQPNFGVGVKYKGVRLDYALTDIGDVSVGLYSNVFSLQFDINKLSQNNANTSQ
ncbi:MAG TPA: hypothetical protein DIU39_08640 [Flavobacteriales bacterium]|nr:hypothetical protein [Flavobacteriales bacterium]|tara:strand:- start:29651 stop:30742 length:1092 start_codon:yes stop_codon:yes gene_type:complete